MVSKGNWIISDILSPLFPLLSLFLLLLLFFSPPYRCFSSSWSSPAFPWFFWHRPSWPYGNWRKMVNRLSLFSLEARRRPGLSGSPWREVRVKRATMHWGFLCEPSRWENNDHMSFSHYRWCLSCVAFTLDDKRGSFLWTMVEKEIQTLPVLLKTNCIIWIKFPSERFENYSHYVLIISHSTTQYHLLSWHQDDLPLTKHSGESIAFRLMWTWVHKAGSATYWSCDLEQSHLGAWVSSIVNQGLHSDTFYMDY